MKIQDLMTRNVVSINQEESVAVAARTLAHHNIGILPVCGKDGKLCGLVTDRDLVTRCLAAGKLPETTRVRDVMTSNIVCVRPDADAATAAMLMGRRQVRRLPVMEDGRLCGMVSIGDLAQSEETAYDAGDALAEISGNISERN